MRVSFVFLAVFIVGIWACEMSEDERQTLKQIHEKCQANTATRAEENLIKQLSQNVDNQEVRAHMLCMSIGAGLQEQNGQINKDTMKNKISHCVSDKSQVDNWVTKCAVEKDTPENTAVNMWMCLAQDQINYRLVL